MTLKELVGTLPEPVRDLNWVRPSDAGSFASCRLLLAAVRVSKYNSLEQEWELSIIAVEGLDDNGNWELTCQGEVWGWNYDDIQLYVQIS